MCTGDEDEDEMSESDDSVEVVERRVDFRHKPRPGTVQGHMSRCSFNDDESDEDGIQLQGRGPITRCVFRRVRNERG